MFKNKQTKETQKEKVSNFGPFNNLVVASLSKFPNYIAVEVI